MIRLQDSVISGQNGVDIRGLPRHWAAANFVGEVGPAKISRPEERGIVASAGKAPAPGHGSVLLERAIVEKATALFDEIGYSATRLQDIADAVGIARSTIYYHYESKEAVLEKILWDLASFDEVLRPTLDPDLSPLDRLRALLLGVGRQVVEEPRRVRIVNRNFAQLPEKVQSEYTAARRSVRDAVRRAVVQAVESGDLRVVDPDLTTAIYMGAIIGLPDLYHPDQPIANDAKLNALVDILLGGAMVSDAHRRDGTVSGVIGRVREDLDYIEAFALKIPLHSES